MKTYFNVLKDRITFFDSHRIVSKDDILSTSIEVPYLPQATGGTVYTSASALPIPESTGHEFVDVCLKVEIKDQVPEIIVLNDKPITRNNSDYRIMMKQAKELQKLLIA